MDNRMDEKGMLNKEKASQVIENWIRDNFELFKDFVLGQTDVNPLTPQLMAEILRDYNFHNNE